MNKIKMTKSELKQILQAENPTMQDIQVINELTYDMFESKKTDYKLLPLINQFQEKFNE